MNHLLAGLSGLMEMQNSLFSVMYLRKLQSMVTPGNIIFCFSSLILLLSHFQVKAATIKNNTNPILLIPNIHPLHFELQHLEPG